MNRPPEISSTVAAPVATTQGLRTCIGNIPAPSRILEVLIASALSSAKTSPRRPSATQVAPSPFLSASCAHSTMSVTERGLLGSIPRASRSAATMRCLLFADAPVAIALEPESLHLILRGLSQRVDRRKHFRRQVDTDFDDLLEGIIGPKNLCDAPVSLGIRRMLRQCCAEAARAQRFTPSPCRPAGWVTPPRHHAMVAAYQCA